MDKYYSASLIFTISQLDRHNVVFHMPDIHHLIGTLSKKTRQSIGKFLFKCNWGWLNFKFWPPLLLDCVMLLNVDMKWKFLFFDMKVQEKLEREPLTFSWYLSQFQRYQLSKKCKMITKVVHQNMAYRRNFGKNDENCDVNRFACQ